ncbi:glycine/sarcosine/betaine reductase selenoprotein B family protein [Bacillus benzoevorans]|uniref:D-proline reductase (Dithiol) PrdB n=1 Tax=Bacillus benzoevorans TaxID=1456 RepID=A0A7X0HTF0_9BACI|nr:D-proline reductase (dithiol) PrdB [Bacillus benzoevorans]
MKLSGNKVIESVMGLKASNMVHPIEGEIPLTPFAKDVGDSVIALVTTSGVHLKSQGVFDVEAGDPTVRFIPHTSIETDLMISHTHFDRSDADRDINCVFPLTRLKELAAEGVIGGAAPTHYGLMGYIPNTKPLLEETIPKIVQQLTSEHVDAVLLNPG